MSRVRYSPLCLVLLLGTLGSGTLQKPGGKPPQKPAPGTPAKPAAEAPRLLPFTGRFEDAKKSALERNVPILVHVILEGEEASDRYRKSVLSDVALQKKSADCLVIIANNGTHAKKSIDEIVDGAHVAREVCSLYPMFDSCAQHQRAFDDMHKEFQEPDGQLRCPQTLVLSPDGKISMRVNNGGPPDPAEVVAGILEVVAKCGPGLTQAQLDEVKGLLDLGRNLMGTKSWPDAWKTWQKVLAITARSVYADEAQRETPKALAGMQAEIERRAALLVPGTAVKGFQELTTYARSLVGTPLEKDVTARLKKAENDKSIQGEIAAWKLSMEADLILVEARDLYEQKQDKKGEKVVRRLLGKRYAATPAAETARKLWPEIAAAVEQESKTPPK